MLLDLYHVRYDLINLFIFLFNYRLNFHKYKNMLKYCSFYLLMYPQFTNNLSNIEFFRI